MPTNERTRLLSQVKSTQTPSQAAHTAASLVDDEISGSLSPGETAQAVHALSEWRESLPEVTADVGHSADC